MDDWEKFNMNENMHEGFDKSDAANRGFEQKNDNRVNETGYYKNVNQGQTNTQQDYFKNQNQSYGYGSSQNNSYSYGNGNYTNTSYDNRGQAYTNQGYSNQGYGQGQGYQSQGYGQGQAYNQGYGRSYTNTQYQDYGKAPHKPSSKKSNEPKYITKRGFAILLIVCMVLSAAIGAGAYALAISTFGGTSVDKSIKTTNYNLSKATGSVLSIQEIVAKNENAVVAISTESVSTDYWLGQYVTQGAGSGVVYSEDGYIITNNHVIEGATSIRVTMHDGTEYDATLVAADSVTDIAVIKIEATGLTPVTFGSMDQVNVGDLVVAIGNPLGELSGTATEGIISALERELTIDNKQMNLIQTSASINPGNSGGGLFDQYGNLIGIVVAKSSGSDVEGLGFAIPCDKVASVAKSLVENGYVQGRPAAGITIVDLTDVSTAMQYGVTITGVYIQDVTGKNAKASGLEKGDLIYYLDDEKITSSAQLVALIQSHQIGDEVTFTIVRNNELLKFTLELEEAQQTAQQQTVETED